MAYFVDVVFHDKSLLFSVSGVLAKMFCLSGLEDSQEFYQNNTLDIEIYLKGVRLTFRVFRIAKVKEGLYFTQWAQLFKASLA